VSFAGFIVGEVNVRVGKDNAAAHTEEDDEEGFDIDAVGELGGPAEPGVLRGACRWSCSAFARAFS